MFILFTLLLFVENTQLQKIILYKYQENFKTNCTSSFVHKKDQIIFSSQIKTSADNSPGDSILVENIQYDLKRKNSVYEPFCYVFFNGCLQSSDKICYCLSTEHPDVFDIIINVTAFSHFSEAKLRGQMKYLEKIVYSEEISFPTIYDPNKTEVVLNINSKPVDTDKCAVIVNATDQVVIFFNLKHVFDIPFTLRVYDVLKEEHYESDSIFLIHVTEIETRQVYTFKYTVCNLQEYSKNFTCYIDTGRENKLHKVHTQTPDYALATSGLIISTITLLILLMQFLMRSFQKRLQKIEKDMNRRKFFSSIHKIDDESPMEGERKVYEQIPLNGI
ncbi:polymorphic transmembrane cluster 2 transmembrane protein 4 [Biomphalaria glabrata]|uniref:Uncharacterized protein LOC129922870 isoform X2 n=1 Tax=Biomphalaria glabrata TaxID=6526 RepID=A0A9W2YVT0_BIOGL|nr:uncharacterized protein LOC129922870 isoform X2 [Biomphalaria glabrata]KAI8746149.1 polymorphic transmembrane cluster 2 transmembrane protein 4 [Biomphalaria glabrata]